MQLSKESDRIIERISYAGRTFQHEGRNGEHAPLQDRTLLCTDAGGCNQIQFLEMKKILLILLTLSLFNNYVKAQETGGETYPKFTVGMEWGYIASLHTVYHYNYLAQEGFRIDDKDSCFGYSSNADIYVNFGWDLDPVWNLSLYIGYTGVGDMHTALPVSIRGTRYFSSDVLSDRWFAFADVGSGICLKTPLQEIAVCKIGCGYQLALSRDTKLDFLISLRSIYTHPNIYLDDNMIPMSRTYRNNAIVSGLSAGIALMF